jgi:predicted metal-dependent hydrolase
VTRALSDAGVPEPALPDGERDAFARGIAQFNDGLFFECHDTLEDLWSGARGPSRAFYQGLIQAAVGFYHLGNGNRRGAVTLLRRSLARLERYPARYAGVELAALRDALAGWLAGLESAGRTPPRPPTIVIAGEEAG